VPRLRTDEEAEAFLAQDLSDLDFSQFKAGQLEYERKDARLTMRLPQPMLDAVKQQARARGIPYQRLVREAIEKALATAGQE
jgi:predicted DNA binding CopG/RHH family protein